MISSRIKIVMVYAVFATVWIFGSDRLLTQWIKDPILLGWFGTGKGVAFVTVTALLLFLLLRIWDGSAISRQQLTRPNGRGRLLGLFLGLSLVAPLLGYSIYQFYRPQIREDAFADLDAIASLKSSQIETWLLQRQNNARVLAHDTELAHNATLLLQNPHDAENEQKIRERFDALRQVYGYDAILIDETGRKVGGAGQHAELAGVIVHGPLPRAMQSGQVQRSELYRDATGDIHLDYVVPLPLQQVANRVAILLHTPVEHFLFPLIQRWPTPSPSAETMLVRRDGDQVLFLNELRHQRRTALTLRTPLNAHVPPSLAVKTGGIQHMETRDRRGVTVLAASRPVAGTSWFVVAKVDRDEVYAPLKRLALWVSLITFAAVIALLAVILLLWRQQQRAHHLELITQSAERDRLLKLFFDLPFVGMSITSPVTKRWHQVNDHLCDLLGYTREELLALTWVELTHPDDLAADIAEFNRVLKGENDAYQIDKRFIRKDGNVIQTTLNARAVRYPDGGVQWLVATIQDISARRRMERMERGHALVLESLVKNQPLAEVLSHLTDLISNVLPGAIGSVLLLDEDGKHLRRGAVKGLPEFFSQAVDGVEIGDGVGSCGTAAFRGERVIVENIAVDPLWEKYRDLASQANLGACWSEPIRASDGRVLGTFAVYFSRPSPFDADSDKLLRSAANMAALAIQSKHAEAAQKTLSDRIESMLESMIDGFVALDKNWRYLYVNRHAAQMFGRDAGSLIGKYIWEEFPESEGQSFYNSYQRVMAQQKPEQIEDFYPPWDKWLENRIYPTPDGITIYFHDITERKLMEAQHHQRLAELTRWQGVMLGREDRVQELKREVNALLVLLGQPIRYPSQV